MAGMNEILANVEALPTLPTTVVRLTAMLTKGEAPMSELEAIIRQDDGLSMTVLRYANSSLYASPGNVFNLKQSLVRLGGRTLLRIVLDQQVSTVFANGGTAYQLHRGALWRSAQGGALAAEDLARRNRYPDPDFAFVCGLLRDVGKLVMDGHFGEGYLKIVSKHLDQHTSFVEAERAALGFDHAMIGSELAQRWQLPDQIVKAIRHHHDPPANEPERDQLFDIIHAADVITLWAGLGIGGDGLQYKLSDHVRLSLGMTRQHAEEIIAVTWDRLRDMENAINAPGQEDKIA